MLHMTSQDWCKTFWTGIWIMCPSSFFSYCALTGDSDSSFILEGLWRFPGAPCSSQDISHRRWMFRRRASLHTGGKETSRAIRREQRSRDGCKSLRVKKKPTPDNKCLLSTLLHYTHIHTHTHCCLRVCQHTWTQSDVWIVQMLQRLKQTAINVSTPVCLCPELTLCFLFAISTI